MIFLDPWHTIYAYRSDIQTVYSKGIQPEQTTRGNVKDYTGLDRTIENRSFRRKNGFSMKIYENDESAIVASKGRTNTVILQVQ
jgi:hypothetical protein